MEEWTTLQSCEWAEHPRNFYLDTEQSDWSAEVWSTDLGENLDEMTSAPNTLWLCGRMSFQIMNSIVYSRYMS